jgi:hypothetical protein
VLKNFPLLFGCIWTGVGVPLAIVFVILGIATGQLLFALLGGTIGGLFGFVGIIVMFFGYRKARGKIRALEHGVHAIGEVLSVGEDLTVQVNGVHPWRIRYLFPVDGSELNGSASTFDNSVRHHKKGQPVHVLYIPSDPGQNTLWPPVR